MGFNLKVIARKIKNTARDVAKVGSFARFIPIPGLRDIGEALHTSAQAVVTGATQGQSEAAREMASSAVTAVSEQALTGSSVLSNKWVLAGGGALALLTLSALVRK